MLLHFILFLFAVICEFQAFLSSFLCVSRPLEFLFVALLDAKNNFSVPVLVVSLCMAQIRGSCGHLKGNYDSHLSCLNCSGCSRSNCCAVCHCWSDSTWALVGRRRLFRDRLMGKTKEGKVKKQRSSASRSSSSSRPGLEQTVSQVDPPGPSSADSVDDDAATVLSLSSSGCDWVRGNTQFPRCIQSHGTPGPKSHVRRPTQRSTPARSQAGDLAGKYGVHTVSQVDPSGFSSADGSNPPPGNSILGTLSQDRSPRSESKRPVERPSSCDTGHNARLATKGSVQQSRVNRPVYSEHAPVTPGPDYPGTGPMTGTRYRDLVPGARFHRPHWVNRVQ